MKTEFRYRDHDNLIPHNPRIAANHHHRSWQWSRLAKQGITINPRRAAAPTTPSIR